MDAIQIERFKDYLKARPYFEYDDAYNYRDLRDAIRHALGVKMPYSDMRKIIDELDKQRVIILHRTGCYGFKLYRVNW